MTGEAVQWADSHLFLYVLHSVICSTILTTPACTLIYCMKNMSSYLFCELMSSDRAWRIIAWNPFKNLSGLTVFPFNFSMKRLRWNPRGGHNIITTTSRLSLFPLQSVQQSSSLLPSLLTDVNKLSFQWQMYSSDSISGYRNAITLADLLNWHWSTGNLNWPPTCAQLTSLQEKTWEFKHLPWGQIFVLHVPPHISKHTMQLWKSKGKRWIHTSYRGIAIDAQLRVRYLCRLAEPKHNWTQLKWIRNWRHHFVRPRPC